MEKDDGTPRQPDDAEVDPTANVVHFPRDWFGPRDELVPFGPGASDQDAGAPPPRAVGSSPVRPDDFWGEDSASIHDAMRGPEPVGPTVIAVDDAAPRGRRGPSVRRVRRAVRDLRPAVRVRLALPTPPKVEVHPMRVAGIAGAACLLVAAVVGSFWSSAVPTPHAGHDSAALSPAVIGPALPPIAASRVSRPSAHRRNQGRTRRLRASHPAARASRARIGGGGSAADGGERGGGSASSGSGVPAATASSGAATQSASAEHSSAGSGGGGSSSVAASSDSGGGGGSSQQAGPVGPGAPFGPGHLG